MSSAPIVRLYSRPDCHLCDQAREQLLALRTEGLEFELEEIDIERDEGMLRRYLERIPVIAVGDEIVSELGLDADGLRGKLGTVSA